MAGWVLVALSPRLPQAFPWEVCVDGTCDGNFGKLKPCATQFINPDNATLMERCAATHGIDFEILKTCATSARGQELLIKDAQRYNTTYGVHGLPVVEVNGKVISKFFSCPPPIKNTVAAICAAIAASGGNATLPAACTTSSTHGSTAVHAAVASCDASSLIKKHEGSRSCVYVDERTRGLSAVWLCDWVWLGGWVYCDRIANTDCGYSRLPPPPQLGTSTLPVTRRSG